MRACGVLLLVAACGSKAGGSVDAAGGSDAPIADAADCEAPDVLIVLDRTMSMHRTPDGDTPPDTPSGRAQAKWSIAVNAVETVAAQFDDGVRFGLELFPRDPGGGVCVTLSQRINGMQASNPECEAADVVVAPAPATGAAIASAIDPDTTLLCRTTPIGAALGTATTALAAIQNPIRDQYVLFVGDGRDTCNDALVITSAQALAADGVHTFVVAFDGAGSGGIDNGLLNDMACAGRTATGFPAPCTADANGDYTATDRNGPPLYLTADDGAALAATFSTIAGQVCCGCID